MERTLYDRLGGAERFADLVSASIDRHAANPAIAPRLRGMDLARLKTLCVHVLAAGWGGPPTYEGADLRAARRALDDRAVAAACDDVATVLHAHRVGPADVDAAVGALRALHDDAPAARTALSGAGSR